MPTTEGFIKLSFMPKQSAPRTLGRIAAPWADGVVGTPIGEVPRVRTELLFSDVLGTWKARWGVGRMRYTVEPGLYAVGNPGAESPVLISANYKMSFDRLRSELGGLDAWILVLDTKGINVWCAAGKGTMGTDGLISRVRSSGLDRVVSHHTLLAPQLSAPGISAHKVKSATGFRVVYGPVRAADLPEFLASGMRATPEMRRVRFPLRDRLVLSPMEIVPGMKYALPLAAAFFLISGLGRDGYSLARATEVGSPSVILLFSAFLGGAVLTPALLPWLPGRAFSVKGASIGLALSAILSYHALNGPGLFDGMLITLSWIILMPVLSSFVGMNFTGSSTFTSLSGVKREMRVAVPLQIAGAALGVVLFVGGLFF